MALGRGAKLGITIGVIVAASIVISLIISSTYSKSGAAPSFSASATELVDTPYVNRDYNFQMLYPKGWTVNEDTTLQNVEGTKFADFEGFSYVVVFGGPAQDDYLTNINVITEDMQGYSMSEYIQATKTNLAQRFAQNSYRLIGEDTVNEGNYNAHILLYVANIDGAPTKVMLGILEDNGQALLMTYAASTKIFDSYSSIAAQTLGSIEFLSGHNSSPVATTAPPYVDPDVNGNCPSGYTLSKIETGGSSKSDEDEYTCLRDIKFDNNSQGSQLIIRSITVESTGGANSGRLYIVNKGGSPETVVKISASNFDPGFIEADDIDQATIPANGEAQITFDATDLGIGVADAGKSVTMTVQTQSGQTYTLSTVLQ